MDLYLFIIRKTIQNRIAIIVLSLQQRCILLIFIYTNNNNNNNLKGFTLRTKEKLCTLFLYTILYYTILNSYVK